MSTVSPTARFDDIVDAAVPESDFPPQYERVISFFLGALVSICVGPLLSDLFFGQVEWVFVVVCVGVFGIAFSVGNVVVSRRRSADACLDRRQRVTMGLEFFYEVLGDDATRALASSLGDLYDLYRYRSCYKRLGVYVPVATLTSMIEATAAAGRIDLVQDISNSTEQRSTTRAERQDVEDVVGRVIEEWLASGTLTGIAFRSGLRQALHRLNTVGVA